MDKKHQTPQEAFQSGRLPSVKPGEWRDIPTRVYKNEGGHFKDIVRRTLLREVQGIPFELRYFEVAKGGYSSLEKHEHTHTVIIHRGEGRGIVGEKEYPAKPGDIFVILAHEAHQFIQTGEEPLGFYCMVPNERDRPLLLNEAEKQALRRKVNFAD